MSACHASSRSPTWLENIIVTGLFFAAPPLAIAAALWLIVWIMGWQLAMTTGAGLVITAYREPISRALPVRTEHHRILGVSRFATRSQIKAAHRRLIQHQHPDRGGINITAADINRARAALLGRRRHA